MGYRVKKHHTKRGWKILFEQVKDGKRITRGVPVEEWPKLGFRPDMEREQALARAREINSQAELLRHETRRNNISDRLKADHLVQLSYFPEQMLSDFERSQLDLSKPKAKSYWKKARQILTEVRLEPKEWDENANRFFKAFIKYKMSPSYVRQVLPLINAWGRFKAKRDGTFFSPIPSMRGGHYKAVAEAHFNRTKSQGNFASAPMTPEYLHSLSKLKPEYVRWLEFSIWFGLRPVEVDLLNLPSGPKTWWVEQHDGIPILWVYQTKLKGVHPDKRVKYIPAFCSEQQYVLSLLGLPMKRPTRRIRELYFDPRMNNYAGRKGFEELMERFGQSFEKYSMWLGHTSVARTYASYMNRQRVQWHKKAA